MDLAFLNVTFLFGALGAAIPLILHLVRRQRAGIHVFSMVRFLVSSQRAVVRQQKFRRLLLLLLRMAACALLAMIFARPFVRDQDESLFAGTQPRAVALLIDNSYSMGYGNRMALVRRRAAEVLDELRTGDQVALLTFTTQARVLRELGPDHTGLLSLLETQVDATSAGTDYLEALRAADDQLAGADFDRRTLYLLSDFHQSGWNPGSAGWKLGPGVQLRLIDVAEVQDDNTAVTDVEIPAAPGGEDPVREVVVRIRNFGHSSFQEELTLRVNGSEIATRRVDIPPRSGLVETFRHAFQNESNSGTVLLGADGLPADNRFYFTVNAPSPVRVLCLEERIRPDRPSDAAYYLSQALSLREDPPVMVDTRTADGLASVDPADYDVIISANLSTLPRSAKDRLAGYVRTGGSLIIGLNPYLSPDIFHSSFGELLPGRIETVSPPDAARDRYRLLADVNYQHPVFRPFAGPRHGDFGTIRFYGSTRFVPDSTASLPARFDNGQAAMAEKPLGSGRTLLFLSTFDLSWNDFPIREVFVPFLYESIDYMASHRRMDQGGTGAYYLTGETVRLPDDAGYVDLPGGERIQVEQSRAGARLFTDTRQPGLYRVHSEGRTAAFAVNLDTRESDFARMDVEAFAAAVVNPVAVTPESRETASMAGYARDAEVERRQRLWWFLGCTLIALVLGETLLANRTHR